MPRPGRLPDPRSSPHNAAALAGWDDVPDIPFDYAAAGRALPNPMRWHNDTLDWYRIVASMPHAIRWKDADWRNLYDLALLKDQFYRGQAPATMIPEIRNRESLIGTTVEYRYKLRIRYVNPATVAAPEAQTPAQPQTPAATGTSGATVTPIASARDRISRGR